MGNSGGVRRKLGGKSRGVQARLGKRGNSRAPISDRRGLFSAKRRTRGAQAFSKGDFARPEIFRRVVYASRHLQFAKRHAHLTVENWKAYIWTDEMSIKVGMERSTQDWVWRRTDEEFHPDCINYKKRVTGTGMMFWGAFRWGKIGPGVFFDLEDRGTVNSTIYRDQILKGPLMEFWEDAFGDIQEPIVMEDNRPVHKGVCKQPKEELKWPPYEHPPNSPDLNPIDNI